MQQLSMQINSLPIQAIFLSNGQIGFSRVGDFRTIIDTTETGDTAAILTNESVKIADEEYAYNTAYNVSVKMREWLKSQKMVSPI